MKVIWLFFVHVSFAWNFTKYTPYYFHKDTVTSKIGPRKVCPEVIESGGICTSSYDLTTAIKTTAENPNALKLWSNIPLESSTTSGPRFAIVHHDGIIEEYVEDPTLQTGTGYANFALWPPNGMDTCTFYDPLAKKVVFRYLRDTVKFYQWHFNDQPPYELPSNFDDITTRQWSACASSPSGKGIIYSGAGSTMDSVYIFEKSTKRIIENNPETVDYHGGCLAYHPMDDNVVYLFGGFPTYRSKSAFSYNIENNLHESLKDLQYSRTWHSCIGYVQSDESPAIMIVGGKWSGSATKNVLSYDINSNVYSPLEDFPVRQLIPNLVNYNGCVYAFAGQSYQGLRTASVFKVNLTSQQMKWDTTLPGLSYLTDKAVVLPYD